MGATMKGGNLYVLHNCMGPGTSLTYFDLLGNAIQCTTKNHILFHMAISKGNVVDTKAMNRDIQLASLASLLMDSPFAFANDWFKFKALDNSSTILGNIHRKYKGFD